MSIIRNRFSGDNNRSNHRAFNQAWRADGVNDFIQTPINVHQNLLPSQQFSISCWVRNLSFVPNFTGLTNYSVQYICGGGSSSNALNFQNLCFLTISGFSPGAGNTFIEFGFQNALSNNIRTRLVQSTRGISSAFLSRWNHICVVYDGTIANMGSATKIYWNGRLINLSTVLNDILHPIVEYGTNNVSFRVASSASGNHGSQITNTFTNIDVTDFLVCSKLLTETEVEALFNFGTNNLYANYPAGITSSRFLHYPLTSGQFNTTPNLRALDISGNNRHAEVFGQGTTPTLVNFY